MCLGFVLVTLPMATVVADALPINYQATIVPRPSLPESHRCRDESNPCIRDGAVIVDRMTGAMIFCTSDGTAEKFDHPFVYYLCMVVLRGKENQ